MNFLRKKILICILVFGLAVLYGCAGSGRDSHVSESSSDDSEKVSVFDELFPINRNESPDSQSGSMDNPSEKESSSIEAVSESSENDAADLKQDESDDSPASNESDILPEPDPSSASKEISSDAPETNDDSLEQSVVTDLTTEDLIILKDPWNYYYEDMLADTEVLRSLYPDLFTCDSLGTTADGRELMHYVVGAPNAGKQVFINAGTHAREYLTSQLVMKQMAVYLGKVANEEYYGGISYRDMWENVAIHVVPMVNPDGITLSQKGLEGLWNEDIRQGVLEIAAMDGTDANEYYLQTWKANAVGTDINRNFDAYWAEYNDPVGHPSSDHYKGEYPGSAIEAYALMTLTENSSFLRTISYHTMGQVIYWRFYNIDLIYDEAAAFTAALQAETGYYPWDEYESVDPAGYSDYGIYRGLIPSVTIECGYGEPPYMQDQFAQIWEENKNIWEVTVLSVYG